MTMHNVKVVVVGNSSVGKTSLLKTYITGDFTSTYMPTVFDKHDVRLTVEGEEVTLGILDTAGSEGFDRLRPLSYVDSDVFLVCFSLADHESFLNAKAKWIPEVLHHEFTTPFVCVGTKSDIRNTNSETRDPTWYGRECSKLGAFEYIECSAKENQNLDTVMQAVGRAGIASLKAQEKAGKKKGALAIKDQPSGRAKSRKKPPCVIL